MAVVGRLDETRTLAEEIDALVVRLGREFSGVIDLTSIERVVRVEAEHFDGARVTDFVPVLTERFSRQRLRRMLVGDPAGEPPYTGAP